MKRLNRPHSPECLTDYKYGANNWQDLKVSDRQAIWKQLNTMQNGFCAYCECLLKENSRHIEHFKNKNCYPKFTFNWKNLFGSCDNTSRCGHYKDSPKNAAYSPDDLIKPDEEFPSDYLLFLITGKVSINSILNPDRKQKAEETIRVFNLNCEPSLVNSRRAMLRAELPLINEYYSTLKELLELFEECQLALENEECQKLLDEQQKDLEKNIEALSNREYQTALEHAWKYNCSNPK